VAEKQRRIEIKCLDAQGHMMPRQDARYGKGKLGSEAPNELNDTT